MEAEDLQCSCRFGLPSWLQDSLADRDINLRSLAMTNVAFWGNGGYVTDQ
jgi:hypothetical protein